MITPTIMKTFLLVLIFLIGTSAFVVKKINTFDGTPELLEFDRDGNTYIVTNSTIHQLHKLNLAKETLWSLDLPYPAGKIMINSQNDVYITFKPDWYIDNLYILREDSLTFEEIGGNDNGGYFIGVMDSDDYVFYNGREGMYMIRPNSTTPELILNLENYRTYIERTFIYDNEGNVFFGVQTYEGWNASLAVITKEAKQQTPPSAQLYILEQWSAINGFTVDQNNDLWIFSSLTLYYSYIKKYSKGELTNILNDEVFDFHLGKAVKDRIYVFSMSSHLNKAPSYIITLDNEFVEIPDLDNVEFYKYWNMRMVADKDGYVYISSNFLYDKGAILLFKPDGTNATGIEFGRVVYILNTILDNNDDLWVVTMGKGVYYLKKDEIIPVRVPNANGLEKDFEDIKLNSKTNEVFVIGDNALYVVVDDSN